jgi:hypothetical protein
LPFLRPGQMCGFVRPPMAISRQQAVTPRGANNRYHPRFREVRESTKYERVVAFADELPAIREKVREHMGLRGFAPSPEAPGDDTEEAAAAEDGTPDEVKLDALWQAVVEEFKVVEIVLEDGDDAQVIFETLNERGDASTMGDSLAGEQRPYDLSAFK